MPHFFDLIDFLRHVEANFPAHPRDLAPYELLRHLSELPARVPRGTWPCLLPAPRATPTSYPARRVTQFESAR